jgi:acetyltransferase-like isoleucine patch superfamily enzyme
LGIDTGTFGSEPWLVTLGAHVTVTGGVNFVTHDGAVWVFREAEPDIDRFGRIVVGDNVFIGLKATILPGVTIGDDSVIAAGAVVVRDVPSGSIVGGVPARVLTTVEAYRARHADDFVFVRSLPPEEKRARVLAHLDSQRD